VSDFDLMLERKKEEMRKHRRRRRDVDIINDNDDLIDDLIRRMMEAAEVSFFLLSFFVGAWVFSPARRPYTIGPMRSPDIQNLLSGYHQR